MIKAPYDTKRDYDILLPRILKNILDSIKDKSDDCLIMCTGTTGTGKSDFMMHAYEDIDPEGCDIKYIGLNRKDHAQAVKLASDKEGIRFCANDEANISKRDATSRYNKALINLYFQIRGLNMFHWWNNPSIDVIDKVFVRERIKGLFYIATKTNDRPRIYYFFTKKALLDILDKEDRLDHKTLKLHAKKYAYYKGWFKRYTGKLRKVYDEKKEDKMIVTVDEFADEWGSDDLKGVTQVGKEFSVSHGTIGNWIEILTEQGIFNPEDHLNFKGNGAAKVNPKGYEIIKEYSENKVKRSKYALKT